MDVSIDNGNSIMMVRHKVVFVGDVFVGKTSIMNRVIDLNSDFKMDYEVNLFRKILVADNWSRFLLENYKIQKKPY